jgi:hypothetical protein
MVQLYEKQLSDIGDLVSSGVSEVEALFYCVFAPSSFLSRELESLHSFGKGFVAFSGSWQCADPSECEASYESAAWAAFRAAYGRGVSSKDGLHHMLLQASIIWQNQAVLSLSLASTGTSSFDLSWLDGLPASDDPELFDGRVAGDSFSNTRVAIAEVPRGARAAQGGDQVHAFAHTHIHSCALTAFLLLITALRLLKYKIASTSTQHQMWVQGG